MKVMTTQIMTILGHKSQRKPADCEFSKRLKLVKTNIEFRIKNAPIPRTRLKKRPAGNCAGWFYIPK